MFFPVFTSSIRLPGNVFRRFFNLESSISHIIVAGMNAIKNHYAPCFLFPSRERHRMGHMLAAVLIAALSGSYSYSREFSGLSAGGPTGLVLAPNGTVLHENWYAAGLHRGMVKAAYGFFDVAEAGFVLPDLFEQPNSYAWKNLSMVFSKFGFQASNYSAWLPSIGFGAENSYNWKNETLYGVGTWFFPAWKWYFELNGGYGTGRFLHQPFGGIGIIPANLLGNTVKFLAEYSGHQADIGARFALAKNLRLDFVMLLKALPPGDNPAEPEWFLRFDKGFLGASRADKAVKDRDSTPKSR